MGLFKKAVASLSSNMGLTDPRLMAWATGNGGNGDGNGRNDDSVGVDKALQLDAVFACVRIVSQTIATLPIMVYRRGDKPGSSLVADEHPLYRVLHDRPNAEMTSVEFWTAMVACKLLWGNAYAAIVRGANGRVTSLEPMRSDRVQVDLQQDGTRTFTYVFNGQTTVYPEEDVFILKGLSMDGITGMSAISAGRKSLGTAIGAETTASAIFKNGLRPSGYLKIPTFLTEPQRAQTRQYIQGFTGGENAGRVPMFEGGWEFQPLTLPPDDAQLLETRAFNVETLCRWFGVPPSLIGHTEKTTTWGTGLEQINLFFLTYTLRPHLKEIEQAISMKLMSPGDQTRFYPEFNVEGLLRADSKGRSEFYRGMAGSGLMTPNEVRALENLPPKPGGDELFIQGAMVPVSVLVKQAEDALKQRAALAEAAPEQLRLAPPAAAQVPDTVKPETVEAP